MSTFDVAVGLDEATLNKALAQLFVHAGVREKVVRGQEKISTPIGEIDITWEVKEPPTLSLAGPPAERWEAAVKGLHDRVVPDRDMVTVVCPAIHAGIEYADGARQSDVTQVDIYAQLRVADGEVTLDPYGVWVDPAKVKELQPSAMNALLFFGLEMAEEALTGLALPAIPSDLGVDLGPPAAVIDGRRLIVGAAIKPGAVDLTGGAWPAAGLFVLGSHDLVNGLVRGQVHRIRGRTLTWRREALGSPGDGGAAVIEGVLEVVEADAQVDASDLTRVGGTLRATARGSAVASLVKAIGLSAIGRILEKIYLAWLGLGYGAQVLPLPLYLGLGLVLEDRTVKVQVRTVRRCVALVWPRGSLPTILVSLVLWPLAQVAALIAPWVLASRANANHPTWEVFSIPTVTTELLGKPLGLAVSGLGCATYEGRLLIRGALDLI